MGHDPRSPNLPKIADAIPASGNEPGGAARIFADSSLRKVYLPWGQTLRMCWASVRNRKGRFLLVLLGISVVVAFAMASFGYHQIIEGLSQSTDVHTQAVLERAGVYARDTAAVSEQAQRNAWLMGLSILLCLFGIANTMLMSVTERMGEIGTLKCLGALDRYVVRLILIESIFLGLAGSLLGVAAGYALALLQTIWTLEASLLSFSVCLRPLLSGGPAAIAFGTGLTIVAALYPTFVAARMQPVEAMRVEV